MTEEAVEKVTVRENLLEGAVFRELYQDVGF